MNNKKKALIIVAFACVSFAIAAFFALYKPAIEKITQKETQVVEEITGDLPELVCDYNSDQEAYKDAVTKEKVGQCECIENAELKNVCKGASMDVMFYNRALSHFDIELCEKINSEVQKDACKKVVESAIDQMKEKNPQHLADIYAMTHNENAIEQLEKITEQDKESIDNYVSLALAYAEKGLREQERGRDQAPYVEKAFEAIESAKSIDENNSEVYRAEAYINEIKPDHSTALRLYDKAIELDPNNILAYAGRGHVSRMLSLLENAVADFHKAAELDERREHVFIYTNLCNLEYSRAQEEDAIKNCKIVINQENADPVFRSEAHQILTMIFINNKEYAQARSALLAAKTLTPNDPNLYVTFSKLAIFQGNYVDAEAQARRAIELASTKSTAYLALSHALYMQERFGEAISAAQTGITLVADDVSLLAPSKPATERDLNYIIAHSHRHMGDSAQQLEYEKRAEKVFEDSNNIN